WESIAGSGSGDWPKRTAHGSLELPEWPEISVLFPVCLETCAAVRCHPYVPIGCGLAFQRAFCKPSTQLFIQCLLHQPIIHPSAGAAVALQTGVEAAVLSVIRLPLRRLAS